MKERRLIVIDFEVLSKCNFWLCCMKDVKTGMEHTIINDRKEFLRVFEKNKSSIWLGYNIKGYDQLLMRGLVLGLDICKISDCIIGGSINAWFAYPTLKNAPLNLFELGTKDKSLKSIELFMGEDIRESSIPFDLDRKPTQEEINELVSYCLHDVRMTFEVFKFKKKDFDSFKALIDLFGLKDKMFSKTATQLSSVILGAKKSTKPRYDEFEFELINTLKINKYKQVLDWYKQKSNLNYKKSLTINVYGVPTKFAWGGTHSARKKYKAEKFIVNSDVTSFYPSAVIVYGLLSRNVSNSSKYTDIYNSRIKMKRAKDERQGCLKLVLNAAIGACKDVNSELYDPKMSNAICVNGQLLLLDLIENVEIVFGSRAQLIQANTDGVMFKFESKADVDKYIGICKEWSDRTKMGLDHDYIEKVIQKDVNNYIVIPEKGGKIKRVGAYLKELSVIDNDCPIVNKALVEYFINGVPVKDTIETETDLMQFQKCAKRGNKYKYILHGNKKVDLKILRVFASKDTKDGTIYKVREDGGKERIAGLPDNVFVDNSNVQNKKIPSNLDKQWYITLAEKRLSDIYPIESGNITFLD